MSTAVRVDHWSLALAPEGAAYGTELDLYALAGLEWRAWTLPGSVATSPYGRPHHELYQLENVRDVQWTAARAWLHRATVAVPAAGEDEEVVLVAEGIDYRSAVYVDGRLAVRHEGMFSPVTVPLEAGEHDVVVVVEPYEGESTPPEHLKARSGVEAYDFDAPLVSAGVWREVSVVVRPRLRVTSVSVETVLVNAQRAEVTVRATLSEPVFEGWVTAEVDGARRRFPVAGGQRLALPLTVRSPRLWWPNGQGEPELVDLHLDLEVPGRRTERETRRVGLRTIGRQAAEGQRAEDFPLQLVINGRPVFLKGVNWVPPDSVFGSIDDERYRPYLSAFRDAGVNAVRVWGGGLRERDAFYDLADEYGLMVLQDFPFSIRRPGRAPAFLRLVEQEVGAIVSGLAHHASVVGWCGGNELVTYWDRVDSGSDRMREVAPLVRDWIAADDASRADDDRWPLGVDGDDEPALALMAQVCASLDGTRPFQLTSAMEGEGEAHGIWSWNPRVGDHRFRDVDSLYAYWRGAAEHLYSEASVSSIANLATIRDVFGADDPPPPTPDDPVWRFHKAFGAAWDALDDLWLDLRSTTELFGPLDLEDLVFASQWMQAEGGRFAVEEIRRQTPRTAGFLWWGVNEPWPALAGNALLDYYGRPKLGWRYLANAYRPTILSARYEHCVARAVIPELWVSHDGPTPFEGRYTATLSDLIGGATVETASGSVAARPGRSQPLRILGRRRLRSGTLLRLHTRLEGADGVVHENDYVFASDEDPAPFGGERLALLRDVVLGG